MKFDRPTLITLTAPTCSGKSYLLDAMVKRGYQRIVGTTTRPKREGEQEGVTYNFLTEAVSDEMEAAGEFAELITFRGTRYGVTKAEMEKKMAGGEPPIVILEPTGLTAYKQLCAENGWSIFKVFIYTLEAERLRRLNARTARELNWLYASTMYSAEFADRAPHILAGHTDRLLSITGDERRWQSHDNWDALIPGDDLEKAMTDIEIAIKWRNHRNSLEHE